MKQTLAAAPVGRLALLGGGLLIAVFCFLWFALIRQLSVEWTVNAQYNYGWAVPLLCAYLAYKRWPDRPVPMVSPVSVLIRVGALTLALLLLPTRLVQEANPDWRLVSWLYAVEVVGLTLVAVRACFGSRYLAHFAFPISFLLMAVPWPTMLEGPLIQALTRVNAMVTVELLNQFGVPALQQGNLIEVSSGVVGIDEACSGIRSLQANLMITFFLGDLYRLKRISRVVLVVAGFGMSFLFNVVRTVTLSTVAAKQGIAAIAQWHDPAGVSILVVCFLGVWLLALLLAGWNSSGLAQTSSSRHPKASAALLTKAGTANVASRQPAVVAVGSWRACLPNGHPMRVWGMLLLLWVVSVELGSQFWYRSRETKLDPAREWSVHLPREATGFRAIPMSEKALQVLRYDEAQNAAWREGPISWQVIFLRWDSGRTAATLARAHTPAICIAAAGRKVSALPGTLQVHIKNLALSFQSFEIQEEARTAYVFYCLCEGRESDQLAEGCSLSVARRWRAVLERRRNLGQRSLEILVGGSRSLGEAEAALRVLVDRILASP